MPRWGKETMRITVPTFFKGGPVREDGAWGDFVSARKGHGRFART